MQFSDISSLFKAINEGEVKQTDCVSFDAQNKTFNSQGRAVRIVHDIGCFLANGILKFITIKKLTDYIARHLDSATVFFHNTGVAEFQNLKGKVTGEALKKILDGDNKEKLLSKYKDTISVPSEMENFLPENVSSKGALSESSKLEANLKTNDLNTPLITACFNGDEQEVKSLLKSGVDINSKNDNEETALITACSRGHEKIVELLIEKNPEINSKNDKEETALIIACLRGDEKIVELLLAKKPDINSINSKGNTALMLACLKRHEKVVKLLLDDGADIDHKNKEEKTALDYAKEKNLTTIEQLLQYKKNI